MVNVNNINRITILGIKGGVGKSTVALTLGKALAISSKSVLIVDRDLIGYSSYILGIRGKGIYYLNLLTVKRILIVALRK